MIAVSGVESAWMNAMDSDAQLLKGIPGASRVGKWWQTERTRICTSIVCCALSTAVTCITPPAGWESNCHCWKIVEMSAKSMLTWWEEINSSFRALETTFLGRSGPPRSFLTRSWNAWPTKSSTITLIGRSWRLRPSCRRKSKWSKTMPYATYAGKICGSKWYSSTASKSTQICLLQSETDLSATGVLIVELWSTILTTQKGLTMLLTRPGSDHS